MRGRAGSVRGDGHARLEGRGATAAEEDAFVTVPVSETTHSRLYDSRLEAAKLRYACFLSFLKG